LVWLSRCLLPFFYETNHQTDNDFGHSMDSLITNINYSVYILKMPTQKQLKTTQKVGGKAPVPQAKAPAKTRGGTAPASSAKAQAKTQGGKAPASSAKAQAKTRGGEPPTTSAKPPAKSQAKTQGGKAPTTQAKSQAKTQGGKAPTTQAKVRGGDPDYPECTIENICDDCNSMGRLESIIKYIIPIEEYEVMSSDEKQKYLQQVKCLRIKVNKRPFLFSERGKQLNETINKFTELLHDKKPVATQPNNLSLLNYPYTYSPPPLGKSNICTIKDFNDCKDISNRCAYTPLGLKMLETRVNNIETEINEYRYKNIKSDSMLKTLKCLKHFLKLNNVNLSNRSLYVKIENYIKKIKKLPKIFRTGQVNAPLQPLNNNL
jgi:hypothetical protein